MTEKRPEKQPQAIAAPIFVEIWAIEPKIIAPLIVPITDYLTCIFPPSRIEPK